MKKTLTTLALAIGTSFATANAQKAQLCTHNEILKKVQYQFNALRNDITLPTEVNGTDITWLLQAKDSSLTLQGNNLHVAKLPKGKYADGGFLWASVDNGETLKFPLTIAPDDERYGYLYCHMAGTSENTLYAIGTKEDKGRKFKPLIANQPVYNAEDMAKIEGGVRDAFIYRAIDGGYLMVTTDMSNRKTRTWFNHGIDLMKSNDLIHWTSVTFDFRKGPSIFCDSTKTKDVYKNYSLINRVWAPQIIWDADYDWKDGSPKGGYFIYYSMLSKNDGDDHDRMYYSYANRDFTKLTKPQLFHDRGIAMIDCHIDWNDCDQQYHIFFKREGANAKDRGIYKAVFDKLPGACQGQSDFTGSFGQWKDILHITNEGTNLTEGPSAIRRINENAWNVTYIRYSGGKAYKINGADALIENIDNGQVIEGDVNPQHGSFMTLTESEYKMLEAWSELTLKTQALEKKSPKSRKVKEAKAILAQQYDSNAVEKLLELYTKTLKKMR
ncbi:MAG: glycoside hydrolase family 43 protein [Bacteroidaceae bacterium]|nr:glycoside hydrolase family 43 protein [Bacteroidaceae bacterium]